MRAAPGSVACELVTLQRSEIAKNARLLVHKIRPGGWASKCGAVWQGPSGESLEDSARRCAADLWVLPQMQAFPNVCRNHPRIAPACARTSVTLTRLRGPRKSAASSNGSEVDEVLEACPLVCPDGFATGVIRSSRLKYSEPIRLPTQRRASLQFESGKPSNVLIIKKPMNQESTAKMLEIGNWLLRMGKSVYVEPNVQSSECPKFLPMTDGVRSTIDFCITLGGDGTLLHLSSLFDQDEPMPPIMSFSMGTLGFLTPFDANEFESNLTTVLAGGQKLPCTLRTRLRCEIVVRGKVLAVHHVLNEVVVDRGAFPGSTMLEIYIDDSYITTVEADGLIIATPSGSTAYSLSVGGSLIAPSVPCTILSPIAPHSLSFRPVIIPESSALCLRLPPTARSSARVSFDGKNTMLLPKGTFLNVEATRHPLPTIQVSSFDTDWYEGITHKLKWNQALRPTPRPLGSAELMRQDVEGWVGMSSEDWE